MLARMFWCGAAMAMLGGGALAQVLPNQTEFRVKLLSPINSETNKKGDTITAQVLTPAAFNGDMLEGKIQEAKNGSKLKGEAVLHFTFDTLHHGGGTHPVQASVTDVVNSQGKRSVDEEGRVVRKKNNLGKAAVGAGLGAVIGAIAGGGKGAAIGAGAGAAAALVLIEVGVSGANVAFAPGSEFFLSVKDRR